MRIHLSVPADLLKLIDARAARERISRNAVIVRELSLAVETWPSQAAAPTSQAAAPTSQADG